MEIIIRLIRAWMEWVLPRPRLVLGLAVVSALISSVYSATYLQVETDQLELISPNHPLIELTERLDIFENDGNSLTLVIQAPTPDRGLSFLLALVPRIKADNTYFKDVFYRVDPDLFKDWALLYLNTTDLLDLRKTLRKHSDMLHGLAQKPTVLAFLELINQEMAQRIVESSSPGFSMMRARWTARRAARKA